MARFEPPGGYRCDNCQSLIENARRSTRRFCDDLCRQASRRRAAKRARHPYHPRLCGAVAAEAHGVSSSRRCGGKTRT